MKTIRTFALLLISGAVAAQTEVPHTFESGEPARASEVNENFGALAAAINDLADAIRELEGESSPAGETVLDFSSVVVEIDQPGFYVLDRDWDLAGLSLVISADRVTVNLRGYELAGGSPTVSITGHDVVLRNGEIRGSGPVTILGTNALLDDLKVAGQNAGVFVGEFADWEGDAFSAGGDNATLRDSEFHCGNCIAITVIADNVEIRRNTIIGGLGGIRFESFFEFDPYSVYPEVSNNKIYCTNGPCLRTVHADGVLMISNNQFGMGALEYEGPLVIIDGESTRFLNNFFRGDIWAEGEWESIGVQVNGSHNLIQGTGGELRYLRVGIQFTGSGNAYGDNCLSGYETNIDLGGTTQTDLGDNCTSGSIPTQ